ncbi:hypothetical protein WOB53_02870 [Providencia rettgeri]|uniref:hypothetical protein n=1 Tax=Providencia rettgeri TaxID=587 RepID=UPI003D27487F
MGKKWLLSLAVGVAIFTAVTFAIFYYWDIDNNNKWSTFFSFTSTFGIAATIGIYYSQKNDENKKTENIKNSLFFNLDPIIKGIDDLLELINDNGESNIYLYSTRGKLTVCRETTGAGFNIEKYNQINELDIYHSKLLSIDFVAAQAVIALKEQLKKYNNSIDSLMLEAEKNKELPIKKSILLTSFNGLSNLKIIKMWVPVIK